MQPTMRKTEVGVLVARFQTHQLHKGHRELLDFVGKSHKKVIVFLGIAPVKVTRVNPLDFFTRKKMLEKDYPGFTVLPIKDLNSDKVWSDYLDSKIKEICDMESVTLYGSKDSFIPYYKGRYPIIELEHSHNISATEIRKELSEDVRDSEDFRAGIVYASFNKYPTVYQTVDVIIEKVIDITAGYVLQTGQGAQVPVYKKELLLGRKKADKDGKWRFIGGFLDPQRDKCLEDAAMNEAYEETGGVALEPPKYVTSVMVDDWRYRKEVDKIVTAVFRCKYMYGKPKASDDIDELDWFDLDKLMKSYKEVFIKEHIPVFEKVYNITLPQKEGW